MEECHWSVYRHPLPKLTSYWFLVHVTMTFTFNAVPQDEILPEYKEQVFLREYAD